MDRKNKQKLLAFALTLGTFSLPALAETKIKSIYFNSDNSIVVETNGAFSFEDYKSNSNDDLSNFILEVPDAELTRKAKRSINNGLYTISTREEKLANGHFFFGKDHMVKIFVESSERNLGFETREILENAAYEISFRPKGAALSEAETSSVHKLSIEKNLSGEFELTQNTPSKTDDFVDNLDREVIDEVLATKEFEENKKEKLDAANLQIIADALVKAGYKDEALNAYRESVKIDPKNMGSRMGIAQTTTDKKEKLENYLKTVKTEALVSIGDAWLENGLNDSNPKTVSAALVSLQYAVLKEPLNAALRYKYAKALEKGGEDYFSQASKRYLEAAAISKKQFNNGEKLVEPLFRNSIESLIRLLSIQGEFKRASKYCKSYLSMGYKKFLTGDPIAAIQKSVKHNKNPFRFAIDI